MCVLYDYILSTITRSLPSETADRTFSGHLLHNNITSYTKRSLLNSSLPSVRTLAQCTPPMVVCNTWQIIWKHRSYATFDPPHFPALKNDLLLSRLSQSCVSVLKSPAELHVSGTYHSYLQKSRTFIN